MTMPITATRPTKATRPTTKAKDTPAPSAWDRRLLDDRTPDVQVVRIDDLNIDHGYQRDLSEPQVSEMVMRFDPTELTLATVSKRADGTLWLVDGGHRCEMLRRLGKSVLYADVRTGLTYEEEAWLFFRLNENHRAMTSWFKFNARLQSKDASALRITAIVEKHGFHISKAKDDRGIQAVTALTKLYDMGRLDDTLTMVSTVWPTDRNALEAAVLYGMGVFLISYDASENYDAEQFMLSIDKVGPSGVMRQAREIQVLTGRAATGAVTMALAFRDAYNGKLVRGSSPKRQLYGQPNLNWRAIRGTPG